MVLTPVEERPKPAAVIRLGPEKEIEDARPAVRLGPVKKTSDVIIHEDANRKVNRTHQPDIDDLIDNDAVLIDDTEVSWGEEAYIRKNRPWGWFILAGLILTGAITWSLLSVKKADLLAKQIRVQTEEIVTDEAAEVREAEDLVHSIETSLRSYFSASTIDSRLRWVRFPDRIAPLMRRYEEALPSKPSPIQAIRVLQPLPMDRHAQFWIASVDLATGESHQLVIECTDEGPRIDWETLVCHQPMPWDEFADTRPQAKSMDFRVYVQPDTFYSHEFANENEWVCYRLSAIRSDKVMFGYVRRGSQTEAEIAELTNGILRASLILRLQIPAGIQSSMGVVIENIMSPRWLYVTQPEEGS